ncbi:translation initiation factor IF-3 [uncultured Bacteroides sp.]|uniref:translation initiation factor IF-3 n=1 Tax=uncultured Bacteroides sp. TaxID=162156 RepID=UPI002AA74699|nr:translation initiation factor IF-3 [uncultured Bacteroides sp.]
MKNDSLKGQYRINEQIRAKEVRIVGDDDIESKVYPIFQALKMAEEREIDLVEISPSAEPPVCRIIDYSKFLYQLKKRQKEQKAKQIKVNVKEIRFGPQTDDHDYNFKLKHAMGFLEDGDKVKAYVFFKGRSILFKEQGEVLLLRFANDLEDYAKVDQMPVLEGKRMTIFLSPKKKESQKKVVAPATGTKPTVVKVAKAVKTEESSEDSTEEEK